MQKTLSFIHHHSRNASEVFPLLCPVREKDWLDGWDFTMIHSISGLVEKGCVFSTPHHGEEQTLWEVCHHDPANFEVGFVRFTPNKNLVHIHIVVQNETSGKEESKSTINYVFTPLTEEEQESMNTTLEQEFIQSMTWWEKAINHYLATGLMLKR